MCLLEQGVQKMERLTMRRLGNRISRHGYPDPGGLVYGYGVYKEAFRLAYLVAHQVHQVIQVFSLSLSIFPTYR